VICYELDVGFDMWSLSLGFCGEDVSSVEGEWGRRGVSWMRGSCNGVDSNSVHPPLKPISTTLSRIRASSSFLSPIGIIPRQCD